jgi:hypothetical protein
MKSVSPFTWYHYFVPWLDALGALQKEGETARAYQHDGLRAGDFVTARIDVFQLCSAQSFQKFVGYTGHDHVFDNLSDAQVIFANAIRVGNILCRS